MGCVVLAAGCITPWKYRLWGVLIAALMCQGRSSSRGNTTRGALSAIHRRRSRSLQRASTESPFRCSARSMSMVSGPLGGEGRASPHVLAIATAKCCTPQAHMQQLLGSSVAGIMQNSATSCPSHACHGELPVAGAALIGCAACVQARLQTLFGDDLKWNFCKCALLSKAYPLLLWTIWA
jgi:hypothetical protein